MEHVILVDQHDIPIGTMEKLEAHKKGILHRAFSILLFNSKGELLLQKRSASKYHSGSLWTNTCCSHPLPNESTEEATRRKLKQEMGIDVPLEFAYKFVYKATLDNNLIEYEYDHVFFGHYEGEPTLNPDEAEDWKYVDLQTLRKEVEQNEHVFTAWFKLILNHPELSALTI